MNAMNANLKQQQQPPLIVKLLRSFIMQDKAQIQLPTHTHIYVYIQFNLGIMIWVASFDYLLPTAGGTVLLLLSSSPACPANNMLTPIFLVVSFSARSLSVSLYPAATFWQGNNAIFISNYFSFSVCISVWPTDT